jgi:precorrin-2 dehydrogenase
MQYYPVSLDIKDRKCLVVGGGGVGTRKVKTLVECGAKVTVVSPGVSSQLLELVNNGLIVLEKRSYKETDLDGMFLVIGTTDSEKLNRQISMDAEKLNMLCNIADRPEVCNFILPSIVNRGDLTISISTSGKSPALAKKLRIELEE